ncbi:MAG: nucleotidyltransferase family protein [Cyclobacteriaceae bacterium]|nr:MAG: nucleotidyltransferase family protein [Cyclobacteriaceae bacterium]
MEVGILLLAAGNSSRLGQSKQLVEVNGMPLLRKSAITALQTNYPVLVVLGAQANAHQKVIADLKTEVVLNPDWRLGMGSSLKTGLNLLVEKYPALQAVLVLVCDQPYLTTTHLNTLIHKLETESQAIIASAYADTWGVPAIFRKELFTNLLQVADAAGARKIIQQLSDQVHSVKFENGEIDLDTPQDLLHLPKN